MMNPAQKHENTNGSLKSLIAICHSNESLESFVNHLISSHLIDL